MEDKHFCRKEAEIAEMHTDLKTVKQIVMGNGQPGLTQTVHVLNSSVTDLNNTIGELKTGVSGLLKFQEFQKGGEVAKDKLRKSNNWIIGILVTALLAMMSLMVTMIA